MSLPFFNPDVFWHLSAARWMLAHGAIPRSDAFSFTAYGAPWIDFEWGTQLVWYAVHAAAGLWGLWALKILLLAAAFWPVDGLLRDKGVPALGRAGALTFWLAAMLAQADLRADLTSILFFGVLLRRLEAGRASFLFGFGLFALWANLHGGFPLGFGLYVLYALTARPVPAGLSAEATGAALGWVMNPYGPRLLGAFAAHAGGASSVAGIMEWAPMSWHNAFQLPGMAAVALTLALAWPARRLAPRPLLAAAVLSALAAAGSARFGAFFAAAGAAFAFTAFPRPRAAVLAAGLAAFTALLIAPVRLAGRDAPFHDNYVPRRAVEFLARERGTLGGLRLYNDYSWGGYVGWRLGPDARVSGDGRYLFQDQPGALGRAYQSPDALARFADDGRFDAFLIPNQNGTRRTARVYPDGTKREFWRPWHLSFFPRERWALVYWDDQALLFVDRAKVPPAWLAAHAYRWLIPGDDVARADALARGEVPRAALDAESARQAAESARP